MRSSGAANFQKAISANIYGGLQTGQNTITDMRDHLLHIFKGLLIKTNLSRKFAKQQSQVKLLVLVLSTFHCTS